jgi:hypothetical protein
LEKRLMKLSSFGEGSDGDKLKLISANFDQNKNGLRSLLCILLVYLLNFSTSERFTDENKCRLFLVLVSAEHCVVFTETAAKSRDSTTSSTSLFFILISINDK